MAVYAQPPAIETATIASSGDTSGVINLGSGNLVGLFIPDTMTSTAITFLTSETEVGTYVDVEDGDGNTISVIIPTSGGAYIRLNPADFAGVQFLKVKTGSPEGAEREVGVVSQDI